MPGALVVGLEILVVIGMNSKRVAMPPVFALSISLVVAFLVYGVVAPQHLAQLTARIQQQLVETCGWFYLLSVVGVLVCVVVLSVSPYGHIPLGKDGEAPEYPLLTWLAMLFCAGMGIGLVFWGVAEPILHYHSPPMGEGGSAAAARVSLRYTFFHWGLHPWGIYTMVALCLAYGQFRHQTPGLVSESCRPLLGKWIDGSAGTVIDSLAVFATVFGVATSLGLGAMQISAGLSHVAATPHTLGVQLTVIGVMTVLFILSAQTGLQRGIKYFSSLNMILAVAVLLFVLVCGPTLFLIQTFLATVWTYLQHLPAMSLNLEPMRDVEWTQDWTLFYWAWWISWAPFVGTFIARISKGRTIREFILGVLVVPTVFCVVWFSVFGGAAIALEMSEHVGIRAVIETKGTEIALFSVLDHFPLNTLVSTIAMVLIGTFFLTSADSATFVLGMLTSGGSLDPPNAVKRTWGILQALIAAVLLWSGGLQGLQTAAIISAFPFAFVMLLMTASLFTALRQERTLFEKVSY